MSENSLAASFIDYSVQKLDDHFAQIRRCATMLSTDQLWYRANDHSNSIANLMLHLRGNVTQWILGGLGERPFERHRQAEFDARGPIPARKLIDDFTRTMAQVHDVLRSATAETLTRRYSIQGYDVTGIEVVYHIVEHFAFHTGQVVTTTKWLLDCDLSLYDDQGHRYDGRQQKVP